MSAVNAPSSRARGYDLVGILGFVLAGAIGVAIDVSLAKPDANENCELPRKWQLLRESCALPSGCEPRLLQAIAEQTVDRCENKRVIAATPAIRAMVAALKVRAGRGSKEALVAAQAACETAGGVDCSASGTAEMSSALCPQR